MNTPGIERAVVVIVLVLFGIIEVEAVMGNEYVKDEILAALGIIGSGLLLWFRSRG